MGLIDERERESGREREQGERERERRARARRAKGEQDAGWGACGLVRQTAAQEVWEEASARCTCMFA